MDSPALLPIRLPAFHAAGELWEKSGLGTGKPGDPYTPGEVHMPADVGKVVQLSTGAYSAAAACRRCVVAYEAEQSGSACVECGGK